VGVLKILEGDENFKNNFSRAGEVEALLQFLVCVLACANCKCAFTHMKQYSKMAYLNDLRNIAFWNNQLMTKASYTKDRNALCKMLVQAREQANLTQKQVADTGVVSQSEISKIENGQRKVEFVVLANLAELYGKPIEYFKVKK
jgi:predicted XRE-type DNA-binding protein